MKKILGILSIAIMAMCFVGCSKNTPEATVDRFMSAIKAGEIEKALEECDVTESQRKMVSDVAKEKMTDEAKKEMEKMEYEVGEAEIDKDGKTAKVEVTVKDKDGKKETEKINLIKTDGKWKISMDQDAMRGK